MLLYVVVIVIMISCHSNNEHNIDCRTMTGGHSNNDRWLLQWLVVILTMIVLQDGVIVKMTLRRGHCYNDHITNQHNNRLPLLQWLVIIITMTWSAICVLYVVVIITITTILSCRTITTGLIADLHWYVMVIVSMISSVSCVSQWPQHIATQI